MEKLIKNPVVQGMTSVIQHLKTNIYWILLETAIAFLVVSPILIAADIL